MTEKYKVSWIDPNKPRPRWLVKLNKDRDAGKKLTRSEERRRSYYETLYTHTPPWETRARLAVVYRQAREMRERGQTVEVDHICPLNHPMCSGLHTVDNLRIVASDINRAKSNNYFPGMVNEQLHLFGDPEPEKQQEMNV